METVTGFLKHRGDGLCSACNSRYTHPQRWSVRLELPSSAASNVCVCLKRLVELCGSEEEKHTPRGQKKLQHEGGSCKKHQPGYCQSLCSLGTFSFSTGSLYIPHLPFESMVLTIFPPKESISISATPSLSFILKQTTHPVTHPLDHIYP